MLNIIIIVVVVIIIINRFIYFPNYDIHLKIISENNINYHFVLMYFF